MVVINWWAKGQNDGKKYSGKLETAVYNTDALRIVSDQMTVQEKYDRQKLIDRKTEVRKLHPNGKQGPLVGAAS